MAQFRAGRILIASLLALAAALALAPATLAMGVMSIDYGTAFMKAALVKPGVPFDVVLGRDSKRKVASAVAWKGEERLFGSDAEAAASRVPTNAFPALKALLASPAPDAPGARFHNSLSWADVRYGNASVQVWPSNAQDAFSPEEIVSMQLRHMRQLAEDTAGEAVRPSYPSSTPTTLAGLDVVLNVPVYFSPWERAALYDAAQLAGMRPRLVSDGLAAATSYSLTRTFPTPERHIFYDSGAGGTQASIVEFHTEQVQPDSILSIGSTPKETTVLRVLGSGWSRGAGGMALDVLVRDLLVEKFSQTPAGKSLSTPVQQNPRAMARLQREAVRVKHILSANAVAASSVESLAEDADWRGSVSREELEEAVSKAGLTAKFGSPITDALHSAGLTLKDIKSVVLVGGNSRVPLVQQSLRNAGIVSFAANVNADEANVMGAAYYGGSFNPQFRMKSVSAIDAGTYSVSTQRDGHEGAIVLEEPATPLLEDHLVRFTGRESQEDFLLSIQADGQPYGTVNVSGISASLADLRAQGVLPDVATAVNLTITSKPLGTFAGASAKLSVDPPSNTGGLASALKGFFGVTTSSSSTSATAKPTGEGNDTAPAAETVTKPKTFNLEVDTTHTGPYIPLSHGLLKKSKDRLQAIDREQDRRVQREELRNLLEGAAYRVRELADPELADQESEFWTHSTSAERSAALTGAEDNLNFLSEKGEAAEAAVLRLRLTEMDKVITGVERRADEAFRRPGAVADFRESLADARTFVQNARTNLTQALAEGSASKYSAAELDTLSSSISKDEKWLAEGTQVQEKRNPKQDPVFLVADVQKRHKKLVEQVKKLQKRRIPKTRPPKKSSASSSPSASVSETGSSSASSSAPTSSESASASTTPTASSSTPTASETTTSSNVFHDDL